MNKAEQKIQRLQTVMSTVNGNSEPDVMAAALDEIEAILSDQNDRVLISIYKEDAKIIAAALLYYGSTGLTDYDNAVRLANIFDKV